MSLEVPIYHHPTDALWSMAAVLPFTLPQQQPEEGLSLAELMDLEEPSPGNNSGFGFNPGLSPVRSPFFFRSTLSSDSKFSLDCSFLEELLSNDVTSTRKSSPESEDQITDRLTEALKIISRSETESLAQVWVPFIQDNRVMLKTREQPFSVMHTKFNLLRYRTLSTGYIFPSQKESEACLGLPGRVFSRKTPEWTPNVQFYDSKEYLRVGDAAQCDVKGLVAVPVIDPGSRSCLAVIELVTNEEKMEFATEINIICRALKAVNLAGPPEEADPMLPGIQREGQEAVFAEISEVLRMTCEKHKLPLAQTWLPYFHNGKGSDEVLVGDSLSESENISLYTKNAPFYATDVRYMGFHQACSEHRLDRGQGVAGKAFISNQPSFMHDVKKYSIEEYPLVHHARYFKLGAAVAIRLRSMLTGGADYIVEFFLPPELTEPSQQQNILESISSTMQQARRTLRTLSTEEFGTEKTWQVDRDENVGLGRFEQVHTKKHSTQSQYESRLHKTKRTKQTMEQNHENINKEDASTSNQDGTRKKLERKRSMNEKTISLEVLQQYFAGSLKDAAKSIGVCPTTLKRICRQYGISRWPSRKINKVNRSLIKLQGVIDSVQGLDGTMKLNALSSELASRAAAITKSNSPGRSKSPDQAGSCSPESAHKTVGTSGNNSDSDEVLKVSSCHVESDGVNDAPRLLHVKSEPRVHGSSAALAALNGSGEFDIHIENMLNVLSPPEAYQSSGDCASPSSPQGLGFKYGLLPPLEPTTVTVKATLGNDTVRFKVPYTGFGYGRLREEIATRFRIELEGFTLKYLDDDSEWVVLDGDADLEECLDVMKAAHVQTIKLVVREHARKNGSSHSLSSVKL